jgi:hypothetical protein
VTKKERASVEHFDADTPWTRDDLKFFAARPGRLHRLRRPFPGEFSPGEITSTPPRIGWRVLVKCIAPGVHARQVIYCAVGEKIPDDDFTLGLARMEG